MLRELRPRRVISPLLAVAAAAALSLASIAPAQAATNSTLGDLSAADPAANQYAGCVAAVLAGNGVTFGSPAALGSGLAAAWSTLPAGVSDACKQAVDTKQPQVCVSPASAAICPAIGAATAAAAADQAAGFIGDWKVISDGVGSGGYGQAALAGSGLQTPMATVSGTFTTPASVCTTQDCTVPPAPGLWTDCGPQTCGPVTTMTVSVVGRTPNGENGPVGVLTAVDGFGNATTVGGNFGNWYWGTGCGSSECPLTSQLTWNCKDALGAAANCGGQSLAVSFTFNSGPGGACGCASPVPNLGQVVEIQLTANNLNSSQNPTVCPGMLDCMRYDDSRLTYLDGSGQPTVVLRPRAAPSAVIALAASDLGCLVGFDARQVPAISCRDVNGAVAPVLQAAHAIVAPPTITATASASGGWQRTPVTVNLTASADPMRGIQSIAYTTTTGASASPVTLVPSSTAQVVVTADGVTTLTYWAIDTAGASSSVGSLTVQVDQTAPAFACATPGSGWTSTDVIVACTAADAASGLANPTQGPLSLTTAVPAGTETATAATGSLSVCDVAGNCATAGPISGLKVDRLGPSINITAPTGTYTIGQAVNAAYTCSDGGSGVATCSGLAASGTAVDTSTAGTKSFTVDATDAVGNHSQIAGSYIVAVPPTITALASPSGGWQRTPVTVSLSASADHALAIRSITYSATGAQATVATAVAGSTAQVVVGADGATTLSYWATDTAGLVSGVGTLTVQVDRTAPALACATPGSGWASTDVTIACTSADAASGLVNPTQARLSLTTAVPAGTETAAAATGSVSVCDVAANCATAGPITGLKVDRLGPSITISAPTGTYTVGQAVSAAYTCSDGGSGVATCSGPAANGAAVDTSTAGTKSFTVDATDAVGNHSQVVATYTVVAPPVPTCNHDESGNHWGSMNPGRQTRNDCDEHGTAVGVSLRTPGPSPRSGEETDGKNESLTQ